MTRWAALPELLELVEVCGSSHVGTVLAVQELQDGAITIPHRVVIAHLQAVDGLTLAS